MICSFFIVLSLIFLKIGFNVSSEIIAFCAWRLIMSSFRVFCSVYLTSIKNICFTMSRIFVSKTFSMGAGICFKAFHKKSYFVKTVITTLVLKGGEIYGSS